MIPLTSSRVRLTAGWRRRNTLWSIAASSHRAYSALTVRVIHKAVKPLAQRASKLPISPTAERTNSVARAPRYIALQPMRSPATAISSTKTTPVRFDVVENMPSRRWFTLAVTPGESIVSVGSLPLEE